MDTLNYEIDTSIDGEKLRRARAAQGLSQRALARLTDIRIATLANLEKGEPVQTLTVRALVKLAAAVCVDPGTLLKRGETDIEPASDDVKVEALLAQAGKAVNRDDIAWSLGWSLERTSAALKALETRLQGTGQRLRLAKFGWYAVGPSQDVLTNDETARAARSTMSEYGMHRRHAKILRRLVNGRRLAGVHTGQAYELGKKNPTADLILANLVVAADNEILLTDDVAFSLCMERRVRTAAGSAVEPRVRPQRAGYAVDRAAPKNRHF